MLSKDSFVENGLTLGVAGLKMPVDDGSHKADCKTVMLVEVSDAFIPSVILEVETEEEKDEGNWLMEKA